MYNFIVQAFMEEGLRLPPTAGRLAGFRIPVAWLQRHVDLIYAQDKQKAQRPYSPNL